MTDIISTMRELWKTMPLPERVISAMKLAVGEIVHLREQRDSLQKHGSDLAMKNQRLRMKELAGEELHREISRLIERVVLAERVALKLWDAYDDAADWLSEEECYVFEGAGSTDGLNDLIESLAAQEHERWSRWEKWRAEATTPEAEARWAEQRETPYSQLPERSKESDRKEARLTLELLMHHGLSVKERKSA